MFDLERSVSAWKQSFKRTGRVADDRVDELESHLREAIFALERQGLDQEEAFLVATKRLGSAAEVASELAKNGAEPIGSDRLRWMLLGYLSITLCGILAGTLASSVSTAMAYAGAGAAVTGVVALLVQMCVWIGAIYGGLQASRHLDTCRNLSTVSLALMFAAMLFLPMARGVATMAQARLVGANWIGETAMWMGFGSFATHAIVYTVCLCIVYSLTRIGNQQRLVGLNEPIA